MKVIKKLSSGLGIAAIIIVFLIPFYIMFYLSLSGAGSSFAEEWFPRALNFENFANAWKAANMGRAMRNSFIITGGAVVVLIFCAASGGMRRQEVKVRLTVSYLM